MLWRKMLRDLWENKGAYIACVIIIVIGLMVFTSYSMVMDNLLLSKDNFYREQNFAEGFIEIQGMPSGKLEDLKRDYTELDILQGRIVKDARVLIPGREDNYLRLVSLDIAQERILNDVQLIQGSPLDSKEQNIWIDNKFFEVNNLELNEELEVIVAGEKINLRVVGMGRNPEFIFAMRNAAELFPDPSSFGIAYVPLEVMQKLLGQGDSINSVVFTLKPGASFVDIEEKIKVELEKYGLKSLVARKDQVSNLMLEAELKQLKSVSKSLPTLFLGISSMILFITLKRMIERQRGQIGILKAFGYTQREILFHYLSYAVLIGSLGGFLGCLAGTLLSYSFTALYQMYFNMPGLEGKVTLSYFIWGMLLSLVFALFAGYRGSKAAIDLEPAEAMRPPAPLTGKEALLERARIFWNMLTVQGRMAIRNISRYPGRTVFVFLGIMFTFTLLGLPWAFKTLSDDMIVDQYAKVQTYNVKIPLATPLDAATIERELARYPGVNVLESMAEIPVTLQNNWHKKDVVMIGLQANSQLYHILDSQGRELQPPREGVLLSERVAQILDVGVGSTIRVSSPLFNEPEEGKEILVTAIVPQYLGMNGYMEISSLQNFVGQGSLCTSVMLDMEKGSVSKLQEDYKHSTAISGIETSTKMLEMYEEMMGSFYAAIVVMILMGMVTGFAIIYNSSLVTLSERSRDLATMMVLGMTPAEVLSVITFEQWFIGLFAMLSGIPLTKLFMLGMAQSFNNDLYSMPTNIQFSSYAIAMLFTTLSIWIAQQIAARKIRQLDLVEVLKARE